MRVEFKPEITYKRASNWCVSWVQTQNHLQKSKQLAGKSLKIQSHLQKSPKMAGRAEEQQHKQLFIQNIRNYVMLQNLSKYHS
ncbi:hypothetical protein BSG1_19944 [Bacillus sp. SG-1]|nr:hypothetical protein BSG1_19944 [Bacillus sp. SG-1]